MKQRVVTWRVLAWWLIGAACGGCAPRMVEPEVLPAPAVDDRELGREFRLHYASPGGMWLPHQMALPEHADTLHRMGVQIGDALTNPFAAPLGAVISLGICTGAFVSPDGLILTAYHCVRDALRIEGNDQAMRRIRENGFLAETRSDELPIGAERRVAVARAVSAVTERARDGLDQLADPAARALRAEQNLAELFQACLKRPWPVQCRIEPYFGGALYLQDTSFVIRDVRLVYAPAHAVGNYGGESDNWKWPRHTGDWVLLRAYVDRDGASQDYAAKNVPYHPPSHLRVTAAGVEPGDFVMSAGYPAHSNRLATAASLHRWRETELPLQIAWENEQYTAAKQLASAPTSTGIRATLVKEAVQNRLAKDEATLAALIPAGAMASKDALDQRIAAWVAQPGHEAHKQAIQRLARVDADYAPTRADIVRTAVFGSSQLLETARHLLQWAEQRARSNAERRPGFKDHAMRNAVDRQRRFASNYDRALDRATFRRALVFASQLRAAERPWLATLLGVSTATAIDEALIDRTLDDWYRAPRIEDEHLRVAWLTSGTVAELGDSADPFIRAARRIWPLLEADDKRASEHQGHRLLLMPWYVDALLQVAGGPVAPDANGSLRISYGTVVAMAPPPDGPAASPFTVASELLAKDTGQEPFRAPRKLLAAIEARSYGPYASPALRGELPINFLSDLDITGGNSGSPVMNRRGEVVGIAFDGTGESAASEVIFAPATNRAISVDIRYLLWSLDLLDGGDRLIEEMGLVPRLP